VYVNEVGNQLVDLGNAKPVLGDGVSEEPVDDEGNVLGAGR
jgi:hypothetical protein